MYNFFERQDDMSYNLVLKATTNFIDEVKNNGYIDQNNYDNFVKQLANTGIIYDIELEAHRKILLPDPNNNNEYIEKYEIDYNKDIFDKLDSVLVNAGTIKQKSYTLNEDDQIYVKVKNKNKTTAELVFNMIAPNKNNKSKILVNYGGVVKNASWKKVDTIINSHSSSPMDPVLQAIRPLPLTEGIYTIQDRGSEARFEVSSGTNDWWKDLKGFHWIIERTIKGKVITEEIDTPATNGRANVNFDVLTGNYKLSVYAYDTSNVNSNTVSADFKADTRPIMYNFTSPSDVINTGSLLSNNNTGTNVKFSIKSRTSDYGKNINEHTGHKLNKNITKFVWNIYKDNTLIETFEDNKNIPGIVESRKEINFKIGIYKVEVYSIDDKGEISDIRRLTIDVKEEFIPFERYFNYNGSYEAVALKAGKYIFEVWGAGNSGYGAYCKGQLNTTADTTFYIYVGGSNGYNGGGSSIMKYSFGGGATDIRLSPGVWNDITSLRSRIIVAGGGGGDGAGRYRGGSAGFNGDGGECGFGAPGSGAGQTYPGSAPRTHYGATDGSFGIGGNGETWSYTSAGAGGGGYYGGGGASSDLSKYNDYDDSGGGGGSSFISGYPGCNAIDVSGYHTNQPVHFSGLSFINMTITGANNYGNGKAKITRVK
ncbi:MAG: glycine rich domain-containing protein [Clostridia bacterium]